MDKYAMFNAFKYRWKKKVVNKYTKILFPFRGVDYYWPPMKIRNATMMTHEINRVAFTLEISIENLDLQLNSNNMTCKT